MKLDDRHLVVVACLAILAGCSDRTTEREEVHEDDHEQVDGVSLSDEAYEAAGIAVSAVAPRALVPTIKVTGTSTG